MTESPRLPSQSRLCVPPEELRVIEASAEDAYPEECCGILVGRQQGLDSVVHRTVPTENRDRQRAIRYEIPPEALVEAMTSARADGEVIVGYFHSHPDGEARPSETDQRESWPGVSYLIVSVADGVATAVGSWRRIENGALEREIVVAGDNGEPGE